jgi:hypothetical protein
MSTRSWSLFKRKRLREVLMVFAMSVAASIFFSWMKAGFAATWVPIRRAASASPCALMILASFSYSADWTTNFARSAYWNAICFASIASVNSFPKPKCVIETSSTIMLKSSARRMRLSRIRRLTCSRMVRSYEALWTATTLFSTSFTIDGRTRSS